MRSLGVTAAVAALVLSVMMLSSVHAGEEYASSPEVREKTIQKQFLGGPHEKELTCCAVVCFTRHTLFDHSN